MYPFLLVRSVDCLADGVGALFIYVWVQGSAGQGRARQGRAGERGNGQGGEGGEVQCSVWFIFDTWLCSAALPLTAWRGGQNRPHFRLEAEVQHAIRLVHHLEAKDDIENDGYDMRMRMG